MIRLRFVPIALAVLALAACNKSGDVSSGKPGEKVAAVAAPAGTKWSDHVETTPEGGYLMGNPKAPIKLVEYGSLSCPHCAKLAQDGFDKLTNDYVGSGKVSYEFRSYVIHPQDVALTLLVKCVPTDAFFPLVHEIYKNFDAMQAPLNDKAVLDKANAAQQGPPNQRVAGIADALGYTQFFSARGLPVDKAHACLSDEAKAKQIMDSANKWLKDGIDSTPSLFINGEKLTENPEWENLEPALKRAGAA